VGLNVRARPSPALPPKWSHLIETAAKTMAGRRVLVIGTFDPAMPRAAQWMRLLHGLGCNVEVRSVPAWDPERASKAAGSPLAMLPRVVRAIPRLAWYLLRCERPDLVVFLYPGHFDACMLGPIARLRRIPAVLDVFISLYDTVVLDRELHGPRSPVALLTRALDTLACWSVARVVVDTPEHADFFAKLTRRARRRFAVLWVGADESAFPALPDAGDDAPILWYLTYIPLHGFETVARAAALLASEGRRFRLVGDGQDRPAAEALTRELGIQNVEFLDAVPESALSHEIARASICLGVFGTSDKASRVVPNKVFQCASARRAVITAATPAVETAFGGALVTVPVGDAAGLAAAISELRGPARLTAAERARAAFTEHFSDAALAQDLARILGELAAR
jgi:glycosyltransferase involved in cell wall biosynthesis